MPPENHDRLHVNGSRHERTWPHIADHTHRPDRLILWRMYGAIDELACVVRSTTYGYTLGLELAGQPILLELQASVEALADKAAKLEAWLLTQGWMPEDDVIM